MIDAEVPSAARISASKELLERSYGKPGCYATLKVPTPLSDLSPREAISFITERLVNLIAIYCILSWRIYWLTMINRTAPMAPPQLALTDVEITTLDRLRHDKELISKKSLSCYIIKIACLGGYLARDHDPPPGNMVI